VLVTRPAAQAAHLVALLETRGARVLCVPLLAIGEPHDPEAALARLAHLSDYDLLVFVSANAVSRGLELAGHLGPLPPRLELAAVGRATAAALAARGVPARHVPERGFDSESLLDLPAFAPGQIAGKRVLVVRGEGGREVLARTLRERGARVDYAEVYRRERPEVDVEVLRTRGEAGDLGAMVVTSGEALEHLLDLLPPPRPAWLARTVLAVPSGRLAAYARRLGYGGPTVAAAEPSDTSLVEALEQWRKGETGRSP
jgi:uroporphyrinogen-III synthase